MPPAQSSGAGTGALQESARPGGTTEPSAGLAASSTTKPVGENSTALAASTTQPADAASTQYDQLEVLYAAASEKPITEQALDPLLSGYDSLLKQDALPNSMRRVAEVRLANLKLRNEAKQEFLATKSSQDKMKERGKARHRRAGRDPRADQVQ